MKNIITAIGNPYLNEKIKKNKDLKVNCRDIIYQEGIIEIISKDKNIDTMLISTQILGEEVFEDFVMKVRKIKKKATIIIFINKKQNINKNFFNSLEIYEFYENTINGYNQFYEKVKNLNKPQKTEKLKEEMQDFRKTILQSNKKIKDKTIFFREQKNNYEFDNKIFAISGTPGIGKTLFSIIFALKFEEKKAKILVITFKQEVSSVFTITGVCNKGGIIKFTRYIDLFLYENCSKVNFFSDLKEIIKKYDYIILDIPTYCRDELSRERIIFSDKIIFLLEPNIIDLKKSKMLLEIYKEDYGVSNSKIKIIFNKTNSYKIDAQILKDIFAEYEVLSFIPYDSKYTLYINKNMNITLNEKNIKEIIEKII